MRGKRRGALERILPSYLKGRRWFAGKARRILTTEIIEALPIHRNGAASYLTLVEVSYAEGDPEVYQLPLGFAAGAEAEKIREAYPHAVVVPVAVKTPDGEVEGILYDASVAEGYLDDLLDIISRRRVRSGEAGSLRSIRTRKFRALRGPEDAKLKPALLGAEQSNTSAVFGDRLILKIFRRLDVGANPDMEIGRFLTERTRFVHAPPLAGALEYNGTAGESRTLAVLQAFVPNEGDAWQYTLDVLDGYFERVLVLPPDVLQQAPWSRSPLAHVDEDLPEPAIEMIGAYLEFARLLGQRTAELHIALASSAENRDFTPEPITAMYRRSVYQSSRSRADQVLELLRKRSGQLAADARSEARAVLNLRKQIDQHLKLVVDKKVAGMRIRCHGDYHLGQVLYTGRDFLIMDFEGEPARPITERRLKRTPLRDVGGMLRSFHYASVAALIQGGARPEDIPPLEPWAHFWYHWVAVDFLKAYLDEAADAGFLPENREQLAALLDLCVIDKALYELAYELNNRPDWVRIPLRGISSLFEDAEHA